MGAATSPSTRTHLERALHHWRKHHDHARLYRNGVDGARQRPLFTALYGIEVSMVSKKKRTNRAKSARIPISKEALLPLARSVIDDLALQHHITLRLLGGEEANDVDFANMGQLVYLSMFLAEAGPWEMNPALFEAAQSAIVSCAERAKLTGRYRANNEEYKAFAAILTLHDAQLARCSAHFLDKANKRLKRFFSTLTGDHEK
jgi:hypothetical protein